MGKEVSGRKDYPHGRLYPQKGKRNQSSVIVKFQEDQVMQLGKLQEEFQGSLPEAGVG